MMRNSITGLGVAIVIMALSFIAVACGGKSESSGSLPAAVDSLKGRKALVVYFSRGGENYLVGKVKKGNTAFLAEYIAQATGADIFEIKAEKPYESYSYEKMLNTIREEKETGEMPEFRTTLKNTQQYDVVFIGGPIWWGTYPRVMFSFFKEYDFDGKIIIPFTTNEGSGLGETRTDLHHVYPHARVLEGFTLPGHEARKPEAKKLVEEWLSTFSYDSVTTTFTTDATTGATLQKKGLTQEGKLSENVVRKEVVMKYGNGEEKKELIIVQGPIDMGGGILWSATNLGAYRPWEIGNYYAWGETAPKESYLTENYAYQGKDIPQNINGTWYDAATHLLGGDWRMPTYEEWHALIKDTTHEFVEVNHVKGRLFKACNGNQLFLPANGYMYGSTVATPNEGYYWSATGSDKVNAYVTYLPENSFGQSNYGKATGIGIRAVKEQ